jgi:hypothetical protein
VPTIATWGDFEIHFDGLLGRGGMGSVYRAWQKSVGRWVAVKVLENSRSFDSDLQQGFLQKFQVEIQALARLNDPRIVTILQSGENEGRLWFAMELIDGETVEKRLTDKGAFEEDEAARIGIEVARALDAALRQKIIHRDVKPANIFVLRDGSVKLGDFGLARSAELSTTRLTDLQAVACTPEYASPEQADGRYTDHRSDLYSLGCVLYEMVTERPPFAGESPMATLYKQASEAAPSMRVLNPRISAEFDAVVLRLLEKRPEERFQSYPELIDALLPPTEPLMPSAKSKAADGGRGWIWPAAAAVGLTLLAVILAAIFTAELAPAAVEAKLPPSPAFRVEPLPAPPPPPPPPAAAAPVELKPVPVREKAPAPARDSRAEFLRSAAEALAAFRSTLPSAEESELVGEIPWGTWRPDLFHAPGGAARFDAATRTYRLASLLESDRVWIKRPFAGCRAGYQVRFRLPEENWGARFALAVSFTRWLEVRPDEARLFQVGADGKTVSSEPAILLKNIAGGVVTVLPKPPHALIFLDDKVLFTLPEAELQGAEGVQLGSSGGTVTVDSVRVKDRSR